MAPAMTQASQRVINPRGYVSFALRSIASRDGLHKSTPADLIWDGVPLLIAPATASAPVIASVQENGADLMPIPASLLAS
jgi:hypothetical protein